jgi:uncharacterized protein YegP (UPF0339 family)
MALKATFYTDKAGEHRWRLASGNNRVIADSGEGYHNQQDCVDAFLLVTGTALVPVSESGIYPQRTAIQQVATDGIVIEGLD